ncbi:MAG: CHAD domain-containing protein [Phycisphaerales bacterium]|nr:CHAD domain-containing protein [Phycisphaerales bacterium]
MEHSTQTSKPLADDALPTAPPSAAEVISDQPDPGSRAFAAEIMLVRIDDLRRHVPHLHDPQDVEHIHQTRVACRRLRTAFELFDSCFPRRKMKSWRKGIRSLGRALGEARDLDVQMEFLQRHLGGAPDRDTVAGLERLLLRLAQDRKAAQKSMRKRLHRFERDGVLADLDRTVRQILAQARLEPTARAHPWLWQQAERCVISYLAGLLFHEPCVEHADRISEHHEMRIAAKRLRYAMEVFASLYEGRLSEPLEVVRTVQKMLGDLHDCDVWIEFLPRFVKEEKRRTKHYLGHVRGFRRITRGLESLYASRVRDRAAIHRAFVEFWQTRCHAEVWTNLRQTLLDHPA